MFRRLLTPLTLANQLVLIVLLLALSGLAGMGLAGWLAQGIQGSAHAINIAGSLRMQSYRLLAEVPLSKADHSLIAAMEENLSSDELLKAAERDKRVNDLHELRMYWQQSLRPSLLDARHQDQVRNEIGLFVGQIDRLVSAFDHATELSIQRMVLLQKVLATLMVLILIFTIVWLRRRLLNPWRQLLGMAHAVGQRDFSQRVCLRGHDEMATLSQAFNSMSGELATSYAVLEQHVAEKTARLALKNEMLRFLYEASRRLHLTLPIAERIAPIFNELEQFTALHAMTLRVYETEDEERYPELTLSRDSDESTLNNGYRTLKWRLVDGDRQYGLVLALMPADAILTQDQQQVVDTLMEQITSTLVQERQTERQQQLMVMEERATIARELHDSIAQSLSCMKMQVSCLQMQDSGLPEASKALLGQIREQINTSWRQLRELLTTFRLKLTEPGLRPALESSCQEFSEKMGVPVLLDYHLPPRRVPSHQAIHVVQVVREALNNSYKHAACSQAGVTVSQINQHIRVCIWDNGRGFDGAERNNHYGLVIMRDRTQSLRGDFNINARPGGGTEVIINFIPDQQPLSRITGENNESSRSGDDLTDR
ncbi:histidine kinase [Salmonella enterica subsp. enterica serovar Choleraesuis]|nr:histidine kinase [Salmonella enterica subsp. enterica serovar Choleraesuis]